MEFLYCDSSFISQRRILVDLCKHVNPCLKRPCWQRVIISQGVEPLLLIFEANRTELKTSVKNEGEEKKEFCPLYVFLPPWHHYCIITDFGHTEAVWLTPGSWGDAPRTYERGEGAAHRCTGHWGSH